MSVFVLIHGAWHGAWCWYRVIPLLESQGHRVIAPDLPGLGIDLTPLSSISLETYRDRICDVLRTQPQPVILVGHSIGGVILSAAAESLPDKISTLVYLTAFLLQDGQSVELMLKEFNPGSLLTPNLLLSEDGISCRVKPDAVKDVFYGDCSEHDVALANTLLRPQPLAPVSTPLRVTAEEFGRVRRVFIECLRDRAIMPSLQTKMYASSPCNEVFSLEASHSAFFSAPEALVRCLTSVSVVAAK